MRHRISKYKLNVTSSHRKAMLENMAHALFKHEQINTTLIKAKNLRPYVEKIITLAKKGGRQFFETCKNCDTSRFQNPVEQGLQLKYIENKG